MSERPVAEASPYIQLIKVVFPKCPFLLADMKDGDKKHMI